MLPVLTAVFPASFVDRLFHVMAVLRVPRAPAQPTGHNPNPHRPFPHLCKTRRSRHSRPDPRDGPRSGALAPHSCPRESHIEPSRPSTDGPAGSAARSGQRDYVTPTLLPAGAIEALALCDAPLPVRLSLPPCSSHARGEPVATVRALPACAARCFCRHAADSAHSPWPEPCTFLRLCVALLRSEGMHRRLQDPVSMREEEVHRTF
jgi:hypothetical protein